VARPSWYWLGDSLRIRLFYMSVGTSIEATSGFVDIAGYTALTDIEGNGCYSDLVPVL